MKESVYPFGDIGAFILVGVAFQPTTGLPFLDQEHPFTALRQSQHSVGGFLLIAIYTSKFL
jgi:hypothetical protein